MCLDVGVRIAERPAIMRHRIRDALGPSRDPLHPAELVACLALSNRGLKPRFLGRKNHTIGNFSTRFWLATMLQASSLATLCTTNLTPNSQALLHLGPALGVVQQSEVLLGLLLRTTA